MQIAADDEVNVCEGKDEHGDWKLELVVDDNGRSALNAAIENAPREDIARLIQLEKKALGNYGSYQKIRSLTQAARLGKIKEVQRLIDAGAKIHGKDKFGGLVGSPLEEAAANMHLDVAEILLRADEEEKTRLGYSLEALETAVERGEHEEVTRLQKGKKFHEKSVESKNMAVQRAAGAGDLRIVKLLVEHGANVDADADVSNDTALASAAKGGHLEMVTYLMEHGANVNNRSGYRKNSPLKHAAQGGHLDIVEMLLNAGADVNADRALHASCIDGHLPVVKRLLQAGASVEDDQRPYRDMSGDLTPLQRAAQGGHLEIVEVLLEAGAKVNLPATQGGKTALRAAASSGSLDTVKRLLQAGADVNDQSGQGSLTAIQNAASSGHLEILNTLLDAGAKLEQTSKYTRVDALQLAIQNGHMPIVNRLLEIGPQHGKTPVDYVASLYAATDIGSVDVVARLLEMGTPPADGTRGHGSLLIKAASKGYTEIVRALIDAGANVDSGGHGKPLQCAVKGGHIDTARVILSNGPDVNAAVGRQYPPLHQATKMKNIAMMQMLLDAKADIHVLSYTGKTALKIAEKGGDQETIQLLLAHGAGTRKLLPHEEPLDVSSVTRGEYCSRCQALPLELFTTDWERWSSYAWQPSLVSLQDSARKGCPFCMFFWKQMGITTITIPRSSPVKLRPGTYGESIDSQIDEPHPKDVECPKTLWCHFNIAVEPFQGKRKAIPGATFSPTTLHQLQYWLNTCASSHPQCNTIAEGSFLPTRLIDLSQWSENKTLRLVEGARLRTSLYMTLSHQWDMDLTPSSRTLLANLESRFVSIDIDSLPQTYIHAIEIVNALHVQYLWIDSLCIIQDDKADWERESAAMNSIFHSSHCTIAANNTEEKLNGLFRSVNVDNDAVEIRCSAKNGTTNLVRALKSQKGWEDMYESGPLRKRGWALEERELSPRILHFTSTQVLWECRTLKASQGLPTKDISAKLKPENKRFMDSIDDLRGRDVHDFWFSTLLDYTSRQLTIEEDTFPALSGLAKIFGEHTKSEYVAGLWAGDLRRSLAWASYHWPGHGRTGFARRKNYIAPTWSWASVQGLISFSSFKASLQDVLAQTPAATNGSDSASEIGIAIINGYSVSLATADPYGRLDAATLSITAPILPAVLGYDASSNSFGQIIQTRDFSGDHVLGDVFFDVPSERGNIKVVRCIYLFADRCRSNTHSTSGQPPRCGLGLALVPVEGQEKVYRRVGHVQCLILENFRNLEPETFTII